MLSVSTIPDIYRHRGQICLEVASGPGGFVSACLCIPSSSRQYYGYTSSSSTNSLNSYDRSPLTSSSFSSDIEHQPFTSSSRHKHTPSRQQSEKSFEESAFEISIWIHSNGARKLGSKFYPLFGDGLRKSHPNDAKVNTVDDLQHSAGIVWHPLGEMLAITINGDLVIVRVVWEEGQVEIDKLIGKGKDISYHEAVIRSLDPDNEGDGNVGTGILATLKGAKRISIGATSMAVIDIGRYIVVGLECGDILQVTWDGQIKCRYSVSTEHILYRIWQGTCAFDLCQSTQSKQLPQVSGSMSVSHDDDYAGGSVQKNVGDRSDFNNNEGGGTRDQSTHKMWEDEGISSFLSPGNVLFICSWSERLRTILTVLADGSIMFMHLIQEGFLCSSRIHPVLLVRLPRSHGNTFPIACSVMDDADLSKFSPMIPMNPMGGSNIPSCEEIVSKVLLARLIDSPEINEADCALLVMLVVTKHLPGDEGINVTTPDRGETISLVSTRICKARGSIRDEDNHKMSQYGINESVNMELISCIRLREGHHNQQNRSKSGWGIMGEAQPCLKTIHLGTQPLVLVAIGGIISCHPVLALRSILFKIDIDVASFQSSLAPNLHPFTIADGGLGVENCSSHLAPKLQHVVLDIALGQLIVTTFASSANTVLRPEIEGDLLEDSKCNGNLRDNDDIACKSITTNRDDSLMHFVSIMDLIKSPMLPQSDGILSDTSKGLVHTFSIASPVPSIPQSTSAVDDEPLSVETPSSLSMSSPLSTSPPSSPGVQNYQPHSKSIGSFTSLSLPPRLHKEVLLYNVICGCSSYFQTGTSARLVQGGLLVANSELQSSNQMESNVPRRGAVVGGAGYLAFIAGGPVIPRSIRKSAVVTASFTESEKLSRNEDRYRDINDPKGNSESICPSLWLYNRQTKRWRCTHMAIGSYSNASIIHCLVEPSSSSVSVSPTSLSDNAHDIKNSTSLTRTSSSNNDSPLSSSSVLSATHHRPTIQTSSEKSQQQGLPDPTRLMPVSVQSISGPLSAVIALSWYGDHTIVLVGKRRSRFCLEVMSREVTKESLASGKPVPLVHKIVPLPPGWIPKLMDVRIAEGGDFNSDITTKSASNTGDKRMMSESDMKIEYVPPCAIVLGNGTHLIAFQIDALFSITDCQASRQSKSTSSPPTFSPTTAHTIRSYNICKLWDIDVSSPPYTQSSNERIVLPIQRIIAIPLGSTLSSPTVVSSKRSRRDSESRTFKLTVSLLLLDAIGKVFDVEGDCNNYSMIDKGPFFDLSPCPGLNWSTKNTSFPLISCVLLQSRMTARSKIWMIPHSSISSEPLPASHTRSFLLPMSAVPMDSVPMGAHAAGICLFMQRGPTNVKIIHYTYTSSNMQLQSPQFTSSSSTSFQGRNLQTDAHGNVIVTQQSVSFALFTQLLRIFQRQYTSDIKYTLNNPDKALELMHQLYENIRHKPRAVILFAETLELRLKTLVELVRSRSVGAANDFFALTTALHAIDDILLFEVISRLSRKLDPATCRKLFPVLPSSPSSTTSSLTALSLYEASLDRTNLRHASRLLTVACEQIGGTDSVVATAKALKMSLELLYLALMSGSFCLSSECLGFCMRIEEMFLMSSYEASSRLRGEGSVSSDSNGQQNRRNSNTNLSSDDLEDQRRYRQYHGQLVTAGTPEALLNGLGGRIFASLSMVSPTLSYYIGGGALWAVAQAIGAIAPAPHAISNAHPPPTVAPAPSLYAYKALPLLQNKLGEEKWQELMEQSRQQAVSSGESIPLHLLFTVCDVLLSQGRFYACALTVSSALLNSFVKESLIKHIQAGGRTDSISSTTQRRKYDFSMTFENNLTSIATPAESTQLHSSPSTNLNAVTNDISMATNVSVGTLHKLQEADGLLENLFKSLKIENMLVGGKALQAHLSRSVSFSTLRQHFYDEIHDSSSTSPHSPSTTPFPIFDIPSSLYLQFASQNRLPGDHLSEEPFSESGFQNDQKRRGRNNENVVSTPFDDMMIVKGCCDRTILEALVIAFLETDRKECASVLLCLLGRLDMASSILEHDALPLDVINSLLNLPHVQTSSKQTPTYLERNDGDEKQSAAMIALLSIWSSNGRHKTTVLEATRKHLSLFKATQC